MQYLAGKLRSNALLAVICASYFMVILDNSIIFTGLPQIERTMQFTHSSLAWVTDAYVLTFGGFLLLGARAGDLLGRRRMFILGLVLFGIASLFVGLAPSSGWLIASRGLQGLGAAILAPSSLALLTENFKEGQARNRAVAAYSAVAGIGASAGLVVGGFLADAVSWRAGFFINIPIAASMIFAALRVIEPSQRRQGAFDMVGALTGTLGMTALVFSIIRAGESGWADIMTLSAFGIGILLLVSFTVNEARARQPIMPLRLFASRARVGAYLTRFLYLGAMMGFFFFTTQYMQLVLGFSSLAAGFGFLPMTAVNFVVALVVTRAVRRFGVFNILVCGVGLTLGGMLWLSRVGAHSNYWLAVALPMVLIGLGQGLAFAPMTSAGLAGVKGADAGASSGVINTFHQMGSAVGLSVIVALAAARISSHLPEATALLMRINTAFLGSSVLLAMALVVVLALVRHAGKDVGVVPQSAE